MTAQASASRYGLPIAAVARIQATLATFPAIEQATLYGSRALGRHRPASDIDLTHSGDDLDPRTLARLDVASMICCFPGASICRCRPRCNPPS